MQEDRCPQRVQDCRCNGSCRFLSLAPFMVEGLQPRQPFTPEGLSLSRSAAVLAAVRIVFAPHSHLAQQAGSRSAGWRRTSSLRRRR